MKIWISSACSASNIEIIGFINVTFVKIKTLETLNLLTSHVNDAHTVLYPAISDPIRTRTGSSDRIKPSGITVSGAEADLGVWKSGPGLKVSVRMDGFIHPDRSSDVNARSCRFQNRSARDESEQEVEEEFNQVGAPGPPGRGSSVCEVPGLEAARPRLRAPAQTKCGTPEQGTKHTNDHRSLDEPATHPGADMPGDTPTPTFEYNSLRLMTECDIFSTFSSVASLHRHHRQL